MHIERLLLSKCFHIAKRLRINDYITSRTVRLINEKDEQAGIVALERAKELAKLAELDLVEVAPNVHPPVCKIMDFGKYLYYQKKVEKKHKKQQKNTEVKGIRLSLRIDKHDLEVKVNQAKKFLAERNVVKVTMILRGRELAHTDIARDKMNRFATGLTGVANLDQPPKRTGNSYIMMLSPSQRG